MISKYFLLTLFFVGSAYLGKAQQFNSSYNEYSTIHSGTPLVLEQSNELTSYNATNLNMMLTEASKRHPLEKTGRTLTFVGVPLLIIGAFMTASADEYYYECVNGVCEGDAQGGFGVVFLAAGAGLTGTGIVLWTIGSKK